MPNSSADSGGGKIDLSSLFIAIIYTGKAKRATGNRKKNQILPEQEQKTQKSRKKVQKLPENA